MKIITVTITGKHHPSHEQYGTIEHVYGFLPEGEDRDGCTPKQIAIEKSMHQAAWMANPGDLILQEDVQLLSNPWQQPDPGTILLLQPKHQDRRLRWHECPQAFIVSDEQTLNTLRTAWKPSRERLWGENACLAWGDIPKQRKRLAAIHP